MRPRTMLLLLSIASLSGCIDTFRGGQEIDPYSPSLSSKGQTVDGLIVGHRLMEAQEFDLALKAYYRAAAQDGVSEEVLAAIGSANLHLGRLGQAEKMLRRALEINGKSIPTLNNIGVVLIEQGKTGDAVEVFKLAFALDSGASAEIRENLRAALGGIEQPLYHPPKGSFTLMREGDGHYLLLNRH